LYKLSNYTQVLFEGFFCMPGLYSLLTMWSSMGNIKLPIISVKFSYPILSIV